MAQENAAAQKPAAPAAGAPATEVVKNCASCNKPMKKAKKYYRNGKYYCNIKCFKAAGKPKEEAEKKE